LEDLIAQVHGVSPLEIHEHTNVPLATHAIALMSMALVLWPSVREIGARRAGPSLKLRWAALAVLVFTVLMGQVMIAGVAAFVSSLAMSILRHRQPPNRE
jgi:hypothetical protein